MFCLVCVVVTKLSDQMWLLIITSKGTARLTDAQLEHDFVAFYFCSRVRCAHLFCMFGDTFLLKKQFQFDKYGYKWYYSFSKQIFSGSLSL